MVRVSKKRDESVAGSFSPLLLLMHYPFNSKLVQSWSRVGPSELVQRRVLARLRVSVGEKSF